MILYQNVSTPATANELTDHSIAENAPVTAVWARGQEFGQYIHNPPSGLEWCLASDYEFYKKDELKYHGTSDDQRGTIAGLDFYGKINVTYSVFKSVSRYFLLI